jgi:predicted unusual protein kinase regulating ubiquinone biosynthesis (AarF/ABC1/UbiB family)
MPDPAHRPYRLRRTRYWRIVVFFLRLFSETVLWEVILRRVLGSRSVARRRPARIRSESRRFRGLAIRLGGVMIKLGQFLSTRVDILPPEITDELAGLTDQVPVVAFDYIKSTVERELGPIGERFLWFNPEPVAAASFGQVHRAQLPTGERVVVKVQRPQISDIVHTDLSALAVVARVAMWWRTVSRRANLPGLLDEFSRVLWEELDYKAEADHALTFSSLFADDPNIYIPAVYLKHSTAYVLTLEDVTSIKLNDYAGLERAGVNRKTVATRLLDAYLRQVFDFKVFHADPHPGNIFIYPIPDKDLDKVVDGRNRRSNLKTDRPFYLIFVDFGMVGRLTPAIHEGLRETIIAVATQDAVGLVAAYDKLGVLLPDANKQRIEEATRAVFQKVWGLNMQELQDLPYEEMVALGRQFSDLLLTMPFQMPQDFIYLSRAVGILSGMCTGLDPNFDPWKEMQPFTAKLLTASSARTQTALGAEKTPNALPGALSVAGVALGVVRSYAQRLAQLPTLAETVLARADRGELNVQATLDSETREQITRIETTLAKMVSGIVFATLTLASTLLYINHEHGLGTIGYILAGIALLLLLMRGRG